MFFFFRLSTFFDVKDRSTQMNSKIHNIDFSTKTNVFSKELYVSEIAHVFATLNNTFLTFSRDSSTQADLKKFFEQMDKKFLKKIFQRIDLQGKIFSEKRIARIITFIGILLHKYIYKFKISHTVIKFAYLYMSTSTYHNHSEENCFFFFASIFASQFFIRFPI